MRVGIVGTRGIPNFYGGFEQFAQYLSEGLVKAGNEVFVYNSHLFFSRKILEWCKSSSLLDPEEKIGTRSIYL